jgi:outer membrane protein assembly factor BamE
MRVVVFLIVIFVSACSSFRFPGVHKITIQQGNVITQTMVDQLRPGMTKNQVRYILGNAIIDDSLDINRWDYVYTLQIAGQKPLPRYMSLFFVDEKLSHFEGDYVPSSQAANTVNN